MSPLPHWRGPVEAGLKAGTGDAWRRRGGLKGFTDGSLGSTTAWFFDPYLDSPGSCGLPSDEMLPEGAMLERVRRADRAGLQVMIHAIPGMLADSVVKSVGVVREKPQTIIEQIREIAVLRGILGLQAGKPVLRGQTCIVWQYAGLVLSSRSSW